MTAAHKRLKGATIYRSIVYGSHATPLTQLKNPPENVNETHTHQWTVSVHGPGNSDVSHFIKKVVFKLHDSFASPNRSVEEPPFEVTETGWGEFEIQVKIYFINEASEKPMTLFHFLHLHPYGPNKEEERDKGLTVEALQYEEIVSDPTRDRLLLVFSDPTEQFFMKLLEFPAPPPPNESSGNNVYTRRREQEEISRLNEAMNQVLAKTEEYKKELLSKRKQLEELNTANASGAE